MHARRAVAGALNWLEPRITSAVPTIGRLIAGALLGFFWGILIGSPCFALCWWVIWHGLFGGQVELGGIGGIGGTAIAFGGLGGTVIGAILGVRGTVSGRRALLLLLLYGVTVMLVPLVWGLLFAPRPMAH